MKTIFYGGTILTMEDEREAQAVLVENGIIKKVGSEQEMLAYQAQAERVDLCGRTMLPAFLDAHSHLSSYANSLLQVPLEGTTSLEEIKERLLRFAKTNQIKTGQWIIASGYDHNALLEKQHPTKQGLDAWFPEIAVVLQHQSGHFGVFNSTALATLEGQSKDQDGYLEESDYIAAIKQVPMPKPEQLLQSYQKAMAHYASYGITTIQEGMMVPEMLPSYRLLLEKGALNLDVVGYAEIATADKFYETFPENTNGYVHHVRLGGYKIILDGSPQGRTAWMKTPYVGSTDEFGIQYLSDEQVLASLQKAVRDGRQLLAHCNGDAATEQFLTCAEKIARQHSLASIRPVMIHAQLLSVDQLKRVKKLGILPSFFVAHCYYWGDTHIENFGFERASQISPTKSALEEGIRFTFHQDTPVVAPDMLHTVWCAVNRKTKAGVLLGGNQRISVLEALRAVTIHAAYQYGEERTKGSIAPGKRADFVILNKNPLTVAEEALKELRILRTYHAGNCIYEKTGEW